MDDTPICNKCCVELLVIPEKDEETGEEMEQGKICPISKPKPKTQQIEEYRIKRKCKAETKKWKGWL